MFGKYLYYRRFIIIFLILFALIFAGCFMLYKLPLDAVFYPFLLCFAISTAVFIYDYHKTSELHKNLKILEDVSSAILSELPPPESIEGEDLRAAVIALRDELKRSGDESIIREREMIDYYTVWVHQIKTPISAMRLKLQEMDSNESRELLAELVKIESYVGMVLAYLRLGSPSTDYVFKDQDLDPIIRSSVKKFAPEFIARKLKLNYEPTDIRLVTDEKWLGFLIEQILSNALKYTSEGSITIKSDGGNLIIGDTGIGISPEDLPRIFEKGFTGLNGRLDKKASGLGLYLCREICSRLSIKISASSEPGQGTEIRLCLSQYKIGRD